MNIIVLELLIIALLLLANGVFAMSEMALVSARPARLRNLADSGRPGAASALELTATPNRFLSTVQVGITLIGIFAGAFGGATLADEIAAALSPLPGVGPYAAHLALAVVVIGITYFSLVVGELVPKRIALQHAEPIACLVAPPMLVLSRIASPVVRILGGSTEVLLRVLRVREQNAAPITDEEVTGLVREGFRAGVFHRAETEMVESVLGLDRLHVRDLMTKRPRIVWIDVAESHEDIWHKIVVSHHTHFPVYEDRPDHVLGILSVKSIYAHLAAGVPVQVRDLVTPALLVPESQSAIHLLETFKRDGRHLALVTDEFGGICGLVTINDLLEAIVGELPEPGRTAPASYLRRADGSLLVDALVGIEELHDILPALVLTEAEQRRCTTLGGYVCSQLGHIPKEGETFDAHGCRFEIIDMDRLRVDKVLITLLPATDTAA